MKEITKAILNVIKEVKNIEKEMTVGSGRSSYKAVSDTMVRNSLRDILVKNNLCIVPTEVVSNVQVDRWDEIDKFTHENKSKQSVLAQVNTKYLLIHSESGESIELAGYGHGVDSQDKAAGKATTYALKNVLLDTFLITKGESEDTDAVHSDDIAVPKNKINKINDDIF